MAWTRRQIELNTFILHVILYRMTKDSKGISFLYVAEASILSKLLFRYFKTLCHKITFGAFWGFYVIVWNARRHSYMKIESG
jgi:hypothetical protein